MASMGGEESQKQSQAKCNKSIRACCLFVHEAYFLMHAVLDAHLLQGHCFLRLAALKSMFTNLRVILIVLVIGNSPSLWKRRVVICVTSEI